VSGEDTLPIIYAKALLDLTFEKGVHREVLKELDWFTGVLAENVKFTSFLNAPHISKDVKKDVIERSFGAHLSEITLNFVRVLIDKRRQRLVSPIAVAFEAGYHERMDELVVRVRAAVPLNDGQRKSLIDMLKKKFQKEIHLVEKTSERLLGGLVLNIGDTRIDGSLRTRLEAVGARLEATRFRSEDYYEN
jgi:F-type H+-transporting ATPase subunit delta